MPNIILARLTSTFALATLLLLPFPGVAASLPQTAEQIPRISVEELLELMKQEPVVVIDTRVIRAWKRAGNKIPGAIRLDTAEEIAHFAETTARQQAIVLYCL